MKSTLSAIAIILSYLGIAASLMFHDALLASILFGAIATSLLYRESFSESPQKQAIKSAYQQMMEAYENAYLLEKEYLRSSGLKSVYDQAYYYWTEDCLESMHTPISILDDADLGSPRVNQLIERYKTLSITRGVNV